MINRYLDNFSKEEKSFNLNLKTKIFGSLSSPLNKEKADIIPAKEFEAFEGYTYWLRGVNSFLTFAAHAALGFFFLFVVSSLIFAKKGDSDNEGVDFHSEALSQADDPSLKKPLSDYYQLMDQRNIFSSFERGPYQKLSESKDILQEIGKSVNIVGILLDHDSKVVIEDKNTHETFFLSVGETLNGVKVQSIEENAVIVDYKGRQVNLTP